MVFVKAISDKHEIVRWCKLERDENKQNLESHCIDLVATKNNQT